MPELVIEIGGRVYEVACEPGQEPSLERASRLLDAEGSLVESDANSSMVSTWTVHAEDAGVTTVRVRTTWNGAGGIGGFFERTFAPKGLRRTYEELLGRLDREVAAP